MRLYARILLTIVTLAVGIVPAHAQFMANSDSEKAYFVLTRLGFGPSGDDIKRVTEMGVDNWIDWQLHPEKISMPQSLQKQLAQFTTLKASARDLFVRDRDLARQRKDADKNDEAKKSLTQQLNLPLREAREQKLLLAIESPRQLQEMLVDFWYNHFNVYGHKEIDRIWVGQYEDQAIRPYVLGHFRDMLEATAKHPAMLYYLDNWKNVAPSTKQTKNGKEQDEGINENYAREVMELHTLGVNGGYTQQDVTQLARILSGWGFGGVQIQQKRGFARLFGGDEAMKQDMDAENHSVFYFNAGHHDYGDKIFLGRVFHGGGIAEGEAALDMLAYSPVTARHLSYELAQFFVADDPPDSLVEHMTATWMRTNGDLRQVMYAMIKSPEFWAEKYRGAKYRTPFQYVVAAVRASGAPMDTEVLAGTLDKMGEEPYGCLTPDGYKNTVDAWLNPSATEQRLTFATALGSGKLEQIHVQHDNEGAVVKIADNQAAVPLDPNPIAAVLNNFFSPTTMKAIEAAAPPLQAAMMLGSPEMMRR